MARVNSTNIPLGSATVAGAKPLGASARLRLDFLPLRDDIPPGMQRNEASPRNVLKKSILPKNHFPMAIFRIRAMIPGVASFLGLMPKGPASSGFESNISLLSRSVISPKILRYATQ